MSNPPLDIIYHDEYLVAVYKPEGLLVHRSNIDRHEKRFLLQELRDQIGQHLYPVHRLDKPTSGLILFALTPEVAALLQADMQSNQTTKEYLLVCRGYCPEVGIIDHPLKPIDDFKSKRRKSNPAGPQETKPAQEAVTEYTRLATAELDVEIDRYPQSRYSFVLARLLSGRKHQIRRHFKHLSHPIIGCPKYGKSKHNHYFADKLSAPRLLLHSYRMVLIHPVTQAPLELITPPVGSFERLIDTMGWQLP